MANSFSVYDGIEAYARRALMAYYHGCLTAVFNDPKNQILTPKGKVTKIRQFESGMAGNYSKSKGWLTQYGIGKGIEWIEYKADFDRAKILAVDAMDEFQSYAVGMTPSIELLNEDFLNNQLPREVDATNIAKWFSQVPAANRFDSATMDISPDGILATLNTLDRLVFNSGYSGDIVLFMSSQAYANLQTAIQNKMGLANSAIMERKASVGIDLGMGELLDHRDSTVAIDLTFSVYMNFLLIRMPDDRMYSNLIMFSGSPDDLGQEAGGYVPDITNPNFETIDLLAIPITAAFTNMRYMIDNFLYPSWLQTNPYTSVDVRKINERMYGTVEIGNAGINQKFNGFEYDVRAIYGGSLFNNRARNCFAVSTKGNPQVYEQITGITLTVGTQGSSPTVKTGEATQIDADIAPPTATNKQLYWSVDGNPDNSTLTQNGLFTAKVAGSYEVTATAQDGSNVSNKITITVENQDS